MEHEFPTYDYGEDDYDEFPHDVGYAAHAEDLSAYNIPFSDLYESCVKTVLMSGFLDAGVVILYSFGTLALRLVIPGSGPTRDAAVNLSSAICGLCALYAVFGRECLVLVLVALVAFALLRLTGHHKLRSHQGLIVALLATGFVLAYEFVFGEASAIHKIRGAQMIMLMKILSIALSSSVAAPSDFQFVGYVFCPGSSVFGPWISLEDYRQWLISPALLPLNQVPRWIFRFFRSLLLSAACLCMSMCFIQWILPVFKHKWISAYQTAAGFRFSHYFVGYLSETSLLAMGFSRAEVTKFWRIEFPRSLVEVVEFWNIPMRNWLKKHVFLNARNAFNTPFAITLTYVASSFLHGLNFQLSAVLLSLALFTYSEHQLRRHLAEIFDACVQARPCKECPHKYGPRNPYVIATNIAFGAVAVFQLAYLGVMFDSSASQEKGYNYAHTIEKWSRLDYAGHYLGASFLVVQYLLR